MAEHKTVYAGNWDQINDVFATVASYTPGSFGNFRRPLAQQRGAPIVQFGTGDSYTGSGTGGTWTVDTTDYVVGSSSRKLTTVGNNAVTALTRTGITPFDISSKRLCVAVKCDNWGAFQGGGSVAWYFSSDNLSVQFFTITAGKFLAATGGIPLNNEWVVLSFSPGDWTVGSTVLSAINAMKVQLQDNNQIVNFWVGATWTEALPSEGVVSFTYDDGFLSTFRDARAKLDSYGYQASLFPICDLVDSSATYMTSTQVQQLHDVSGWEVGVHAFNATIHNIGYAAAGGATTEEQFQKNLAWLRNLGIVRGPEMLAWPLGIYDTPTLQLARKYFRLARSTNAGSGNNFEGRYPTQYHRLKCRSVVVGDSVGTVNGYIDQAATNKEWLILLFHDIGASGQMTVANHNLVVDHANSNGIKVRTLGDALTLA